MIRWLSAKTTSFLSMMLFLLTQALRICIRYFGNLDEVKMMTVRRLKKTWQNDNLTFLQVVCVRQFRPECPPRWQGEDPQTLCHDCPLGHLPYHHHSQYIPPS